MFHQATKQWRENEEPSAESENERHLAFYILIQSFRDYHKAKRLIQKKKVTVESFHYLGEEKREDINNGKSAWEWFVNKPKKNGKGWTFRQVCDCLGLDVSSTRKKALMPSTWRTYCQNMNVLAGRRGQVNNGYSQ